MDNLNSTELGRALNDAGIGFCLTNTRQHEPRFEYFDDDFTHKHGNEWATVDYFMIQYAPIFINVRVKDYNRTIDLIIYMESQDEHSLEDIKTRYYQLTEERNSIFEGAGQDPKNGALNWYDHREACLILDAWDAENAEELEKLQSIIDMEEQDEH